MPIWLYKPKNWLYLQKRWFFGINGPRKCMYSRKHYLWFGYGGPFEMWQKCWWDAVLDLCNYPKTENLAMLLKTQTLPFQKTYPTTLKHPQLHAYLSEKSYVNFSPDTPPPTFILAHGLYEQIRGLELLLVRILSYPVTTYSIHKA